MHCLTWKIFLRIPDWVTHLGNEDFPPKSLFQCPRWWILNFIWGCLIPFFRNCSILFINYIVPRIRGVRTGESSWTQRQQGLGHAAEQLAVKFPSFKSQTGSQELLLVATLGSQTALHRWTSVAQQSFVLWETELKVSTKTVRICCFILDVVPSNSKRTEIKITEILITHHTPLRTHLHGSTSVPVWNTFH